MISIIIPAYNSSATIVESLESVLAQTVWSQWAVASEQLAVGKSEAQVVADVPAAVQGTLCESMRSPGRRTPPFVTHLTPPISPPYEVIIVDDCSTDDTVAVVQRWMAEKELLSKSTNDLLFSSSTTGAWRVLRQAQNAGPAAARNAGIMEAKGDWIAFLDADDIWLPHRVEAGLYYVRSHPATVMVCGKSISIGAEDSRRTTLTKEGAEEHYSVNDSMPVLNYTLDDFLLINPVATSTVLIRKDVLKKVGGFDAQFRGPEDYDLWLRVVAERGVVRLEIPVSGYRHRPGSLSLDDRKFLPQVIRVLDKAYARGGVYEHRKGHARAVAYQWLCGAWSAAERGDFRRAVQCFVTSFLNWPWPISGDPDLRWARSKVGYYIGKSIFRRNQVGVGAKHTS